MRPEGAPRGFAKPSWTRETLIRGMAKAIRELDGEQLTIRSLKEIARGPSHEGIPAHTTVQGYMSRNHPDETWQQWVSEAAALAREPGPLA